MPRLRNPRPISSYDARYRLLLLQGARERVELPATEYGKAVKLRQEMQNYRAEAKRYYGESAKDQWEPLYQSVVRMKPLEGDKWIVYIEPRSAQFEGILPSLEEVGRLPTAHAEGASAPSELGGLLDELSDKEGEKSS